MQDKCLYFQAIFISSQNFTELGCCDKKFRGW